MMLELAQRLVTLGIVESQGNVDHPFIIWALSTCVGGKNLHDETPWCSAAVNLLAILSGKPHTDRLNARSWLRVGEPVSVKDWQPGDVAIFSRGPAPQPGPEVTDAAGHVTIVHRIDGPLTWGYGGNQKNMFSLAPYSTPRLLGLRRL